MELKKKLNKLENYPIGICGTVLAFMTISNAWKGFGIDFLKPISVIVAIGALVFMLIRAIMFPKKIVEEIKNPVLGSFYPTIDMALFLIASAIIGFLPTLARGIWLFAVVFHFIIFIAFFTVRLIEHKFKDMVPSWFVVWIGMVVGTVASPGMGFPGIAKFLCYFGIFFYVVTWPIMVYRMYWHKERVEDHKMPTVGIMAAPASLCIAGYLTITHTPNMILLAFLAVTSLFNLGLVYTYIIGFIKKGFAPTYAALTFPLAISVVASLKMSKLFMNNYILS
ncbi:MAG: TDT family transporter, partial [Clostridium sp.]|uniref:TDT family transporter n=1 Tax=Clostridium sp. TaxID=1506 RepID=UPI003EE42AB6